MMNIVKIKLRARQQRFAFVTTLRYVVFPPSQGVQNSAIKPSLKCVEVQYIGMHHSLFMA